MKTLLILSIIVLAGCANVNTIKKKPLNDGEKVTFFASQIDVIKAVQKAISEAELDLKEVYEEKDNIIFIAESFGGDWDSGSIIRVVISSELDYQTVHVISKRKVATQVAARNYTDEIISNLHIKLSLMKG